LTIVLGFRNSLPLANFPPFSAAKEEKKKAAEPEEEEDMGFSLFD
jgi:ribosomal protein L12E/L44/L45/RPP1/RPP2